MLLIFFLHESDKYITLRRACLKTSYITNDRQKKKNVLNQAQPTIHLPINGSTTKTKTKKQKTNLQNILS